jgi:hypothetical protein
MPYLGSTPNASFSSRTKQDFTANGSTTAFTLSSAVASPNDIEVFVGNVRQEPTDAYTVNGTTLTMSAAPSNGINFYVVFKGLEENSVVPAAGTTVPGAFGSSGLLSSSGGITNTAANSSINSVATGSSYAAFTANASSSANAYMFFQQNGTEFGRITAENGGALLFSNGSSATERLRILSTGGITFNGDTAATNALDDYEEGTWTPTVSSASSHPVQTGIYTKIGNLVTIQCVVQFVQSGSVLGSVSGLPFVVSSVNYTGITFREWYSTGITLSGNLTIGSQSTTGFWNYVNNSAATNGQTYGYGFSVSYRT